jgi:hypothetical protein
MRDGLHFRAAYREKMENKKKATHKVPSSGKAQRAEAMQTPVLVQRAAS